MHKEPSFRQRNAKKLIASVVNIIVTNHENELGLPLAWNAAELAGMLEEPSAEIGATTSLPPGVVGYFGDPLNPENRVTIIDA